MDVIEIDAATNTQVDKVRELIIDNARVGEGLVRQGDGKLVLAGSIDVAVPPV